MDRPITQKKLSPRKIAAIVAICIGAVAAISLVVAKSTRTRLDVDANRLSVAQVKLGEFQEYVPINGKVEPNISVYLDLQEGGIVDKVYVESGNPIKQGDLILVLSNTAAEKENIETETRLLDNLNQLRNSKISLTQSNLQLKDQLLDIQYKLDDTQAKFSRFERLVGDPNSSVSREVFETTRDQLAYYKGKRDLLQERIRQETALEEQQSTQIDSSIASVNRDREILSRIIESLQVRAPIDGHLSTLNAQVGQSLLRGQRIGQIDELDSFKVRADIDQYYVGKVAVGQKGKFELDGSPYELEVTKIYPEVKNDVFQADLKFLGAAPEGIKRGQTLQIDLSLSEAKATNMVEKGGFYRYTNGRWAYLLSEDGRSAHRARIVLGRQNPQSVEVLEGLKAGDWIITSNYDSFGDVDELTFPQQVTRR
jgi:HlyD family secretion protein